MPLNLELALSVPPAILITGSALLVLLIGFLLLFLIRGIHLRIRLSSILRRLHRLGEPAISDLQKVFEVDTKLLHLWKEFYDTLHKQKEERDGQIEIVSLRATVPADSFFNEKYVVDTRLRTEFFKHLPGIFTGIGIIGTFLGLITGLQAFKVSEDAGQVRESLELLLGGVFEAFLVSATAISLAMVVTLLEKALLASLYRITEDIAQYLDSLYAAGANEDYLSRLVNASEESASQSKILKDAFIGELKQILQQISDKQLDAQASHSQKLGNQITSGIENSLKDPLKQISDVVSKASGDQSATAAQLLKDVMASFSQKLNELFSGQITGIQELNQKTALTMQEAVTSLNGLVQRMEGNSKRAEDTMTGKMAEAVTIMADRQEKMNQQTQAVIERIRQMVSTLQTETNAKLEEAITKLNKHVTELIEAMKIREAQSFEDQQRRENSLQKQAEGLVTSLGSTVDDVVKQMATSTKQMQESIDVLQRTSTSSIEKLNASAESLNKGALSFAQAGEKVTESLEKASTITEKMTEISGSLTSASSALQSILKDYRENREDTRVILSETKAVIDAAKREASLTQEALAQIDSAAAKLALAQKEVEQYLQGISNVLAEAHNQFADGLVKTLERANSDFHEKLSSAVGLLSQTIQELDVTLSSISFTRR